MIEDAYLFSLIYQQVHEIMLNVAAVAAKSIGIKNIGTQSTLGSRHEIIQGIFKY